MKKEFNLSDKIQPLIDGDVSTGYLKLEDVKEFIMTLKRIIRDKDYLTVKGLFMDLDSLAGDKLT